MRGGPMKNLKVLADRFPECKFREVVGRRNWCLVLVWRPVSTHNRGRPEPRTKEQKQRRAERAARAIFWLGWATWPVGAYFAGSDIAQQFVIGLSELALIYSAWTARLVVDPDVG